MKDQRIIEFRVWDKEYKEWLKQCYIDSPPRFGWYCESHPQPDTITFDWILSYPDIWTTQQFTGLLDKNGKKIFEGDIVKVFNHEVFHVISDLCSMYLMKDGDTFAFGRVDDINGKDYEILGNIFENPDLIK